MSNPPLEERLRVLPLTIRTMIENTPLLAGEKRENFIGLFLELGHSPDGGAKTTAEYIMVLETTKLIFNLQRLEQQRVRLIEHLRPAAVIALHIRTSKAGIAEPGSVGYILATDEARRYFASEEGRKRSMELFRQSGYSPDAVETESYLQAHPLIISIQRQVAVAERLLMSFLRELDHRNSRRAEEIRRAAAKALARGRVGAMQNTGAT